jgi:hypothetical protein
MPNKENAIPQNVTLYPTQRSVVEAFAQRTNRTFSNALQFIIEDWQRIADPENQLRADVASMPAVAPAVRTSSRKRPTKPVLKSATRSAIRAYTIN